MLKKYSYKFYVNIEHTKICDLNGKCVLFQTRKKLVKKETGINPEIRKRKSEQYRIEILISKVYYLE